MAEQRPLNVPVNAPEQVKPIYGNPNLTEDLQLQRERGQIKTDRTLRNEMLSSVANGISGAVDNFYGIQEKSEKIEQMENQNRIQELEIQKEEQTQDLQIEAKRLGLENSIADNKIKKELLKDESDAYAKSSSDDVMEQVDYLSNPRFAKHRAKNPEYAEAKAQEISKNYPQFRQTLQDTYYAKKQEKDDRYKAELQLKELEKQRKDWYRDFEEKSPIPGLEESKLDKGEGKIAKIIETEVDGKKQRDVLFTDGTKASDYLGYKGLPTPDGKAEAEAQKKIDEMIRQVYRYQKITQREQELLKGTVPAKKMQEEPERINKENGQSNPQGSGLPLEANNENQTYTPIPPEKTIITQSDIEGAMPEKDKKYIRQKLLTEIKASKIEIPIGTAYTELMDDAINGPYSFIKIRESNPKITMTTYLNSLIPRYVAKRKNAKSEKETNDLKQKREAIKVNPYFIGSR